MAECLVWIQAIVVRFRVIPVTSLHFLRSCSVMDSLREVESKLFLVELLSALLLFL